MPVWVSYQCHSCSPIIDPNPSFHQLSRPESQRDGYQSKDIGGDGGGIALRSFAFVNVDERGVRGTERHRETRFGFDVRLKKEL